MPKPAQMSSTTAGVAVAVSASTRAAPELARALRELEVVGTEVVAPLRDAVRLVDGEQRDLHARELGHEALVVEALGRDVEQAQLAPAQSVGDVAHLREREARVDARRGNAELARARRSDPS